MYKLSRYGETSELAQKEAEEGLPEDANMKGIYLIEPEGKETLWRCTIIYRFNNMSYAGK